MFSYGLLSCDFRLLFFKQPLRQWDSSEPSGSGTGAYFNTFTKPKPGGLIAEGSWMDYSANAKHHDAVCVQEIAKIAKSGSIKRRAL